MNFGDRILDELKDFAIWGLRKLISWIKSVLNWCENLVSDIAEEARHYLLYFAVFFLGLLIYKINNIFAISNEKKQYLSIIAICISVGSILIISIHILKSVAHQLGLIEIWQEIHNKIIDKIKKL